MTPSSIDSQFLVIKIELPNENFSNVEVDLTKSSLVLFAKFHRLYLELPHQILEKTAKAKFSNSVLEITV